MSKKNSKKNKKEKFANDNSGLSTLGGVFLVLLGLALVGIGGQAVYSYYQTKNQPVSTVNIKQIKNFRRKIK